MSQADFGNISAGQTGADFFDNKLEPWRDALHTMHSGTSSPSYAVAGTQWLDTSGTPWIVKVFDGTDDIAVGTVNASTNVFTPSIPNSTITTALIADSNVTTAKIADANVTQPKLATALRMQLNLIQDFRLTLTTSVPVTTSDVTGATTIYCAPYNGNSIALYDGTNWNIRTSAQFSIALGTLTSGKLYDVFCYDNAGTPTLELSAAWNSSTARFASGTYATELPKQDGVFVKSTDGTTIDATRRYLGTFYTTSTTTTEDSLTKRYLYNYYNRVTKGLQKTDATTSWTYTTAAFRQANNSTANQVEFIQGVAEDVVNLRVQGNASQSGAAFTTVGIGIDSTTVNSGSAGYYTGSTGMSPISNYSKVPAVGRHYAAWLEYSQATGTTTWYGTQAPAISEIAGSVRV